MEILKQTSSSRENLGLLAVMEALEDREKVTQRELARLTGLNLKKVNYSLHKLLEKGFVKFQKVRDNPDKRAYLYILTPSGLKAKSRLTYGFLKFTLDFYTKVESKLRDCLRGMKSRGIEQVLLYGASDVARILIGLAEAEGIRVVGLVDDSENGFHFHGIEVISPDKLNRLNWDAIFVTALEDLDGVEERLAPWGVESDQVIRLS